MKSLLMSARAILFGAGSFLTFSLAVYSTFYDRAASAAVAGALSLAFLFMSQLPNLETFEAFTLKVKLRQQIGDAEKLLSYMKDSASVSAKLAYIQLAFMNRMGDIPWSRKRGLLADIDTNLGSFQVSEDTIFAYKRPFLNIVSFDLYRIYAGTLDTIIRRYFEKLSEPINNLEQNTIEDVEHFNSLIEARNKYVASRDGFDDILGGPRLRDLEALTNSAVQKYQLDDADLQKLKIVQKEVIQLSGESWLAGTITPEAENYINKYQTRNNLRLDELEGR